MATCVSGWLGDQQAATPPRKPRPGSPRPEAPPRKPRPWTPRPWTPLPLASRSRFPALSQGAWRLHLAESTSERSALFLAEFFCLDPSEGKDSLLQNVLYDPQEFDVPAAGPGRRESENPGPEMEAGKTLRLTMKKRGTVTVTDAPWVPDEVVAELLLPRPQPESEITIHDHLPRMKEQ